MPAHRMNMCMTKDALRPNGHWVRFAMTENRIVLNFILRSEPISVCKSK